MFYLLGVFLSVFLFLILISKKGKTVSDKILAVWLIFIGFTIYHYYQTLNGIDLKITFLLALGTPLPIIHGPMLFIYTASLTNQLHQKKYKIFLHFIPIIVAYFIFLPFYLLDGEQKIQVFKLNGKGWETEVLINLYLIYISGVVYIIWSLVLLRKHRKNILQQFSDIEKINLNWLRYLIIGTSGIWVFVFYGNDNLIYGSAVVFIAFIGFYGIKQVGIFTYKPFVATLDENSVAPAETTKTFAPYQEYEVTSSKSELLNENPDSDLKNSEPEIEGKKKYQKSGLRDADAITLHKKLGDVMLTEKLFTDPELTLADLALKLGVHPNILSQVINTLENKNFYDYVNDQRIEEFKRIILLEQNQKYTLLSLAHECGFNSKTTFNRNFKKVMGVSPSDYLKSLQLSIKE